VITYLWIAAGSALGGMARYACANWIGAIWGAAFPYGTLVINVLGSFIIGLFSALSAPEGRLPVPTDVRLFVTVGICGGYTTFSSFSLQTLALAQDGQVGRAGLNIGGSVVLCLLAVWIGWVAGLALNKAKAG
jgi:CrcB protein